MFRCKYCKSGYKHHSSLYRHMKKCMQEKDQDEHTFNYDLEDSLKIDNVSFPLPPPSIVESNPNVPPDMELLDILKKQSDTIDRQMELINQQNEKLEKLITEKDTNSKVENNFTNNNIITNNSNIVYITDQLDYLEILNERFGEKEKTIEFIKNKLHSKIQGDIDVFSAIHLNGPPNTWPIRCPDKNKKHFYLVQPDNSLVPDPGGITTHKNFYRNLQTAVLKLINQEIIKVVDQSVGSEKFEGLRDGLLDDFDLQAFQTRALEMSNQKVGPFVKQLMEEMGQREIQMSLGK